MSSPFLLGLPAYPFSLLQDSFCFSSNLLLHTRPLLLLFPTLFVHSSPYCFSFRPCTFIQGPTSYLPNHFFHARHQLLFYLTMLVHKRPLLLLFPNLWPYIKCPMHLYCFSFRPCSCVLGLSCILGCYFFL